MTETSDHDDHHHRHHDEHDLCHDCGYPADGIGHDAYCDIEMP